MFAMRILPALLLAPLLGGCLGTIANVVTLPVRAASAGVDAVTTSQSERDQKRGKQLRQREERLGKLARERDSLQRRCDREPGSNACNDLFKVQRDIDNLTAAPI